MVIQTPVFYPVFSLSAKEKNKNKRKLITDEISCVNVLKTDTISWEIAYFQVDAEKLSSELK